MAIIKAHNADGTSTWRAGVNKFTDMLPQERAAFKGIDKHLLHRRRAELTAAPRADLPGDLPDAVDWRDQGVVREWSGHPSAGR